MTTLNLGAEQAGQWIIDLRISATLLSLMHSDVADEVAERLAEMAEAIEDQ